MLTRISFCHFPLKIYSTVPYRLLQLAFIFSNQNFWPEKCDVTIVGLLPPKISWNVVDIAAKLDGTEPMLDVYQQVPAHEFRPVVSLRSLKICVLEDRIRSDHSILYVIPAVGQQADPSDMFYQSWLCTNKYVPSKSCIIGLVWRQGAFDEGGNDCDVRIFIFGFNRSLTMSVVPSCDELAADLQNCSEYNHYYARCK